MDVHFTSLVFLCCVESIFTRILSSNKTTTILIMVILQYYSSFFTNNGIKMVFKMLPIFYQMMATFYKKIKYVSGNVQYFKNICIAVQWYFYCHWTEILRKVDVVHIYLFIKKIFYQMINVFTKTKLFPSQYTNKMKSRLHVNLIVFVYKMCL